MGSRHVAEGSGAGEGPARSRRVKLERPTSGLDPRPGPRTGLLPLDLIMSVRTDPALLDVAGALAALPRPSLNRAARADAERAVQ